MPSGPSPFVTPGPKLQPQKFVDPRITAKGETRARVPLHALNTLWFNTGSLCNLACANCFMESSPTNDALLYLTYDEVRSYLDEVTTGDFATGEIGFTGGEPFMNPDIIPMLTDALDRGFDVLVLTNGMRPMRKLEAALLELRAAHGDRLTLRVSLDHYDKAVHEAERGERSFDPAMDGLVWLSRNGFRIAVAGRHLASESDADAREGYRRLFEDKGIAIDTGNPGELVLFPEMDETIDVPEITTACWQILGKSPKDVMCATSRMVVKRKGEDEARVAACTLLPYDREFDMGGTLNEARRSVALNHPHCAKFCVLGGASCSA
ncbi:radical SAM protein [Fulvimarina endophytica]|uniref:Radical SAM protein n=2 Tax=Fulvimarina endophytica TaxID=2293836 RepID=A0A371WZT6_9HYPH|nr:radical SAM protein [Fulvimarina endophytica]